MKTIDTLVAELSSEIRVYEASEGYSASILHLSRKSHINILQVTASQSEALFAVRHEVFRPTNKFSLRNYLPDHLDPPEDVIQFYNKICFAWLWWKTGWVLEMPGWAGNCTGFDYIRGLQGPSYLLRFCELTTDCYYALRTNDNGVNWDVIFTTGVETDEIYAREATSVFPNFTAWLDYMHANDGWPPWPGYPEDCTWGGYYRYVDRRLPDSEVITRYGSIEALLPRLKIKVFKHLGECRP